MTDGIISTASGSYNTDPYTYRYEVPTEYYHEYSSAIDAWADYMIIYGRLDNDSEGSITEHESCDEFNLRCLIERQAIDY